MWATPAFLALFLLVGMEFKYKKDQVQLMRKIMYISL